MAKKVDAIQRGLVELLIAHGCSWQSTTIVGKGCPDGFIGYRGITVPVEFKDPKRLNVKGRTADAQAQWRATWRGGRCYVLSNWAQCEEMMRVMAATAAALGKLLEAA